MTRIEISNPRRALHSIRNHLDPRSCSSAAKFVGIHGPDLIYTLGRNYDCRTGESTLGPRPSRKKVDRLCSAINELTMRRKAWRDVEELMSRINRKLRGWSDYSRLGTVSKAYRNINSHTRYRVRQWLCAKFKEQGHGKNRLSDQYLHQELGLYQLERA